MRPRHRLGTAPTDQEVNEQGVNIDAIPLLERGYEMWDSKVVITGAAPKNFVVFPETPLLAKAFVAKRPSKKKLGARECVTEYLIARLGRALPLRVADARIVRLPSPKGEPPDVRFMSRYFLRSGEQALIHGVELVAQAFGVEKQEVAQAAQSTAHESQFYTVDMIDDVLGAVSDSPATHSRLRDGFARMMAFDALVGANDRHAENWGVIEDVRRSQVTAFAPVYDTARGLLLWNSDESLSAWYARGQAQVELAKYAHGSDSLIGTGALDRPNHFKIFEYMVRDHRFRSSMTHIVAAYTPGLLHRILCNDFYNLFSRVRLRAIADLMAFRHATLVAACRDARVQLR